MILVDELMIMQVNSVDETCFLQIYPNFFAISSAVSL